MQAEKDKQTLEQENMSLQSKIQENQSSSSKFTAEAEKVRNTKSPMTTQYLILLRLRNLR
jgi:hypothetical protein